MCHLTVLGIRSSKIKAGLRYSCRRWRRFPFLVFSSFSKHPYDMGLTWIIHDNPPISQCLISSAMSLLPYKVAYSQVLEIRIWTDLEGCLILSTTQRFVSTFWKPVPTKARASPRKQCRFELAWRVSLPVGGWGRKKK